MMVAIKQTACNICLCMDLRDLDRSGEAGQIEALTKL